MESISEILGAEAKTSFKAPSVDLFSTTLTTSVRTHQVFRPSPVAGRLPLVVIPKDDEIDDFFATIATYHPDQSPITAYIHVLTKSLSEYFDYTRPSISPDRRDLNRSQVVRLGAAMGETVAASLGTNEAGSNPSYSACRRSLGYALARTSALYPNFDADIVVERWQRLRRLTGLTVLEASVQATCLIHAAASDADKPSTDTLISPRLYSALASHLTLSGADATLGRALNECYSRLDEAAAEIEGPFDARMRAFLNISEIIINTSQGTETDNLAIGYFCNRILPGSFSHGRILARLVDSFPSALVWYGVFCAASSNFDAHHFEKGLFLKLGRDISQSFSFAEHPRCDLSLDELDVLMRASMRSEAIKPIQQKIISVSLLPGLNILSRFASEDDSKKMEPSRRSIIADERLARATKLLREAVSLLDRLEHQEHIAEPNSNPKRQRNE